MRKFLKILMWIIIIHIMPAAFMFMDYYDSQPGVEYIQMYFGGLGFDLAVTVIVGLIAAIDAS